MITPRATIVFKALAVFATCCCSANAEPAARLSKTELSYGEHSRQSLDLYRAPILAGNAASPVVVYFHGGGFNHGDKANVSTTLVRRMHEQGISVASVNYRFVTTDALPASMLDGARAVQFLRHIAAEHRLDVSRIATTGSSAGGGIALYVALHDDLVSPDSPDPVARNSSRVSCVYAKNAQVSYDPEFWRTIGLSAAMNAWSVDRLYGTPKQRHNAAELANLYARSSPIAFLTADDPPIRLDYSYPSGLNASTPKSALIHHPFHGIEMKRQCDTLGVSCDLSYPDVPAREESGYDFLIRHLTKTQSEIAD